MYESKIGQNVGIGPMGCTNCGDKCSDGCGASCSYDCKSSAGVGCAKSCMLECAKLVGYWSAGKHES